MPAPHPPPPRPSNGRLWAATAVLVSLAAASVAGVGLVAARARAAGPGHVLGPGVDVVVVRTGGDAVRLWRARGLRGRVVVHAGRFLHYVAEDRVALLRRVVKRPGDGRAVDEEVLRVAGARNYLWVAASTGIARRLVYVSPPAAFHERLQALGRTVDGRPVRLESEAVPRDLRQHPDDVGEAALVDVSASWFDDPDAPDLLAALQASGLRAALVTVTLAEDAADVTPAARAAAARFAAALSGGTVREEAP